MLGWLKALPLLGQLAAGAGALLAAAGVLGGVYAFIWHQGYGEAEQKCNAAALEAQIKTLQFDLHLAQLAAGTAKVLADAAADRQNTLEERLSHYVDASNEPVICALDDAGAQRLLDLVK